MVPDRSRSSKHVRIPPLNAAFPHRSACTKKQLAAREGSSHAPNVNPFESEACTAPQEARFFAMRKLSLHHRRLRRRSAPTVASEARWQGGMDRCVDTMARRRCAPTIRARQACNERAAFATSRTMPCAACGRKPGYWPDLVGRVLAPDRKSFPKYKAEKRSRAASLNVSAPTGQWAPDLTCRVSPVRRSMSSRRSVRTFSTVGIGCASGCIGWAVGPTATSAASMASARVERRGGRESAGRRLPNQAKFAIRYLSRVRTVCGHI